MIPAGYNAKLIAAPEQWLGNADVREILSVSECLSGSPIDHHALWLCNAWSLYDTAALLEQALAQCDDATRATARRFFYAVHPEAVLDGSWTRLRDLPTDAAPPADGFALRGYDVACFGAGAPGPDCSPLSCNSGAGEFPVNELCLLPDLESALAAAQRIDAEGGYEPGPYAVFAVWEAQS